MESPPFILNHEKRANFTKFDNFINWTMTYRSDADVYFSYLRTDSLLDFLQHKHDIDDIISKKTNVAVRISSWELVKTFSVLTNICSSFTMMLKSLYTLYCGERFKLSENVRIDVTPPLPYLADTP